MTREFASLVVIAAIAAFVPLIVGLLRIKVAEVVLLLGGGILFGPYVLGWISVDSPLARALLKKRADEELQVELPTGPTSFVIVDVHYD